MYLPESFEETRVESMHDLIRCYPLATLVTLSSGSLNANHIPFYLSENPQPFGTLQGHVARSNPLWRNLSSDIEALVVFHGPEAYISPSWYATKRETDRVVPTWNYVVVHAYGTLRSIEDAHWIRLHLDNLTAHQESEFSEPWKVADAPTEFLDEMINAIVGIEMVITKLTGKWKISQNQSKSNKAGVINGLRERSGPWALIMSDLVASHYDENDS
jgi:transcriptional regulator